MADVTEKDVLKVIEDALMLKEDTLTLDASLGDFDEWDSMGQLSILTNLDEFFDGKVGGIKEMANADSVEKILKTLKDNSLI